MSLRTRLALLFGTIALGVTAVVALSAFASTSQQLGRATDSFLSSRAAELADGIRTAPTDRRQGTSRGNGGLPVDPDSIVQSLGRDGGITGTSGVELPVSTATLDIATADLPRGARLPSSFEDVTVDGVPYRMYVQALSGGGAVQVARATTEADAVLDGLVDRFVLIGVLASIAAAVAGWFVARQTTRPLRRLAQVAAEVADTRDFSTEVAVDRTDEIGVLAGSFQHMLTALQASREQQRRLVHDAGHELRTPLTSLRVNVELLERARTLPPAEQSEVLAAIRAELVELSNLFDELMDLAVDDRNDTAVMERFELGDIAVAAVEHWQRRTGRMIEMTLSPTGSPTGSPTEVIGDRQMLERALTNLLGNADKFSPSGAPIDVVVHDGSVIVRDRGPGVPPEDRTRIFDRFYRADSTRSMPGSGLGLAIVAQIVERHGGTVWATDAPGGGAEVGFRLPGRVTR